MAKANTYNNPNKPAEQIGGTHYSRLGIEPIQFIETNGLGYHEGNVIKYVSRWRNKNGVEDLKKAKWYIERLLELETEEQPQEIEEGAGFTSPCACGQPECTDFGGVRSFKAGVYNQCSSRSGASMWYAGCPGTGDWAIDKAAGNYAQATFLRLAIGESEPPNGEN